VAALGHLESLLAGWPSELKRSMLAFVRGAFTTLHFGTPGTAAVAATNFGGHLVPVTTSGTPDQEVAVAHGLGRVPRWLMPALDPNVAGGVLPVLTVTRAADATFFYLSSDVTDVTFHVYAE